MATLRLNDAAVQVKIGDIEWKTGTSVESAEVYTKYGDSFYTTVLTPKDIKDFWLDVGKSLSGTWPTVDLYSDPLPHRVYSREELGLENFPEIRQISVRGCVGDEAHISPTSTAHTHVAPCDPAKNTICFSELRLLRYQDGTLSDGFWHEYGHVLNDYFKDKIVKCGKSDIDHAVFKKLRFWIRRSMTSKEIIDEAHGEGWQRVMRSLGKPHINSPYLPYNPLKYFYTDKQFEENFLTNKAA